MPRDAAAHTAPGQGAKSGAAALRASVRSGDDNVGLHCLPCPAVTRVALLQGDHGRRRHHAMTFAASGAAPTTLYQRYQEIFGLTPFILTVIFGAYVLSLLGALLTVGSLSD